MRNYTPNETVISAILVLLVKVVHGGQATLATPAVLTMIVLKINGEFVVFIEIHNYIIALTVL